jgi:LPXTG-motif cell wall-anchored protein
MKINKSFIRIALAAGLIGLAACGGSDSSSRQRNSEIATNVKRYQGTIQVSGRDFGSRNSPDKYAVSFDMNLDAVSTQEFVTGTTTRHGDFRNAFSQFSIKKDPNNQGTLDLSNVKWAQCPYDSYFYTNNDTTMSEFQIVLVEAPNSDVASAPCGQRAGLWTSSGERVGLNNDARYLTLYFRQPLEIGTEDFPSLVSLLPEGLDPYFVASENVSNGVAIYPYSLPWDANFALSLSSTKLKDYQPYELTATQQASTIDLNWKRSADLVATDVVSYSLLWSTDGFETSAAIPLDDVTEYKISACLINPENKLAEESKVSLQLIAIDSAGITSPAIEKSVSLTADTVQCPTTDPIAAPTGFKVVASQEKITASWTAIENTDPNVTLNYCVSEVNPNLPDPTSDDYQLTNDSDIIDCTSETTLDIFDIRYQNTNETKYFVQVQAQTGALSARSEIATITTPKQPNVVGLTVSSASDGLNIKWDSSGLEAVNQVILLFSVDVDKNCDQTFADVEKATKTKNGINDVMNRVGAVINAETFFLSKDRLGNEFVPGSVLTVCAKRMGVNQWSESADWGIATYTNPATTDAPAATIAPVVEETAKTAIVTETATEVQLPAAAVEVAVKVEDVYTGFGVTANDVKSIEYQIDAGSWTAVTPGAALKIPNAASKMAVRVTKTNGETVVSEKAIVRTEETTETTVAASDTTMAPADTTAPETTEAPASSESSESSSSNNILLYIFGLVILAAIAGFFFKKKNSASTK